MHPNQPHTDSDEGRRDKDRPAPIERASGGQHNADEAAAAAPGERAEDADLKARQEDLLDEAVEETFPASDPISPKRIT
ncbi:hypothetical protein [Phenylobacterium sp.]|jgi:hypothetical protein|uniref:hypothetical protein n=1 Tax=Phenylobacterium sp. TaxID=1871053 RepID=UPI002E3349BE|nr:hypothetical protein [Phenylobacterium sp.]HEX2561952.1 hypothetical protein [Phenylobacterium sp.]